MGLRQGVERAGEVGGIGLVEAGLGSSMDGVLLVVLVDAWCGMTTTLVRAELDVACLCVTFELSVCLWSA